MNKDIVIFEWLRAQHRDLEDCLEGKLEELEDAITVVDEHQSDVERLHAQIQFIEDELYGMGAIKEEDEEEEEEEEEDEGPDYISQPSFRDPRGVGFIDQKWASDNLVKANASTVFEKPRDIYVRNISGTYISTTVNYKTVGISPVNRIFKLTSDFTFDTIRKSVDFCLLLAKHPPVIELYIENEGVEFVVYTEGDLKKAIKLASKEYYSGIGSHEGWVPLGAICQGLVDVIDPDPEMAPPSVSVADVKFGLSNGELFESRGDGFWRLK